MSKLPAVSEPLFVTKPVLPDLNIYFEMLKEVWASSRLTNNGPKHSLLEANLKDTLKAKNISLFNNGTIALMIACQSLQLSGEVITTPFTFPATPHVLTWNNIKPLFCDIDPLTLNIDAERIESLITPQTKGILAVHVFGTPCDVVKIQEVADRYKLRVVYDAAHAFGVEIGGRGVGTYGDISMFSFHATKLFHTAEGGALTFNDENLKTRIDLLKNFGIKNEEEVAMPGINGKMNEIQAALGLALLGCIDAEKIKRKKVADAYRHYLGGIEGITIVFQELPDVTPSYQYFVIRISASTFGSSRDEVFDRLRMNNIYARKYFFPLCSNYPSYQHLPTANPVNLQVANNAAKEVLALPFYGDLSDSDIEKICHIIIGKNS
ncbi:MAG: DegT/DnrJ/EryC1/StrS family aminotransferase [Geobacteraceae bacterium]|nr:DegT/DnrJ/EryC1/StrS family aminotransferase [Geobacteraceae bacterium]